MSLWETIKAFFTGMPPTVDQILVDVQHIVERLDTAEQHASNQAGVLMAKSATISSQHLDTITRLNAAHDAQQQKITATTSDLKREAGLAAAVKSQLSIITSAAAPA